MIQFGTTQGLMIEPFAAFMVMDFALLERWTADKLCGYEFLTKSQ